MEMLGMLTGTSPDGRVQSAVFGDICLDAAIQVHEYASGLDRYTLLLEQKNPIMWTNLIIRREQGSVSGYLIEYWPQLSWLQEQQSRIRMEQYEGLIGIKALNGTPIAAAWLENGLSTYSKSYQLGSRVLCDEGGSGGGDGGAWGDFGDVAAAGSSGGSTDTGGGGEACTWHLSETTGMLVIDCPDVGIVGINLRLQCDNSGDSGAGGAGEGTGTETGIGTLEPALLDPLYLEAEALERKIDSTELDDCVREVLTALTKLPDGLGFVVQKFAKGGADFDLKVVVATPSSTTSVASTTTEVKDQKRYYITRINPLYLETATDLSIAKTILHESIHAYLLAYYYNDPRFLYENYPQFLEEVVQGTNGDLMPIHHEAIIRSFVSDIATSLRKYGESKGYDLSNQFYEDLAWGGLTTMATFSQMFSYSERVRIQNVIKVELEGVRIDMTKVKPKGTRIDC